MSQTYTIYSSSMVLKLENTIHCHLSYKKPYLEEGKHDLA
jgi:hypothetical protein